MSTLSQFTGSIAIGQVVPGTPTGARYLAADGVSSTATTTANAFLGEIYPARSTTTANRTSFTNSDISIAGVAYGNGIYVAVGPSGWSSYGGAAATETTSYYTSVDGSTWTTRAMAVSQLWQNVIYQDGLFVAMGTTNGVQSSIAVSRDGINWVHSSAQSVDFGTNPRAAVLGTRIVIIYGSTQYFYTSIQGSALGFALSSGTAPVGFSSITTFKNAFVACDTQSVYYSTDGITWTAWLTGQGSMAAVSSNGTALVWTNASVNATRRATTLGGTLSTVTAPGLRFIASNGTGFMATPTSAGTALYTSTDGSTWTTVTTQTNLSISTTSQLFSDGTDYFLTRFFGTSNTQIFLKINPAATSFLGFCVAMQSKVFNSIAYSSTLGLYVAVGTVGLSPMPMIVTSTDGASWTFRALASSITGIGALVSVKWNGSIFVAVGNGGITQNIASSTDGLTWFVRTSGSSSPCTDVAFGNSLWVATKTSTTQVSTSSDGITWSAVNTGQTVSGGLLSIAWNGTRFVCGGGDVAGQLYTSTTGAASSWAAGYALTGASDFVRKINTFGTLFIAQAARTDLVYTSTVGAATGDWTTRALNTSNSLTDYVIASGTSTIVAIPVAGSGANFATSTNGTTWASVAFNLSTATTRQNGSTLAIGTSGTQFVFSTNSTNFVQISSDAATWSTSNVINGVGSTSPTLSSTGGVFGTKAYDVSAGVLYSIEDQGNTYYIQFPQGPAAATASQFWTGMAWNGTIYVAFGQASFSGVVQPIIATSTNGITWTTRTAPTITGGLSSSSTPSFKAAVWTGSQFIAIGSNAVALTSPDGIAWTARDLPFVPGSISRFQAAWCAAASLMVVIPESNLQNNSPYWTSPDGITWTRRLLPGTSIGVSSTTCFIAASSAEFVMVSSTPSYAYRSTNGTTWTSILLPNTTGTIIPVSLIWDGTLFVLSSNIGNHISKAGTLWSLPFQIRSNSPTVKIGTNLLWAATSSNSTTVLYDTSRILAPGLGSNSVPPYTYSLVIA